jgi:hypothetical protein
LTQAIDVDLLAVAVLQRGCSDLRVMIKSPADVSPNAVDHRPRWAGQLLDFGISGPSGAAEVSAVGKRLSIQGPVSRALPRRAGS